MAPELEALLSLQAVSRSFGGVRAANGINLVIAPGSVHGLIGPNGAGKTTVLNLISGILRPTGGAIRLRGRRIDSEPAYRIAELGIRRTYQNIRLFGRMTARDNIMVGLHSRRADSIWQRLWFSPRARRDERWLHGQAIAALDRVGIGHRARDRAGDLPYDEQRRLEIARALASEPALLLLDEPAAGMSAAESSDIGALIRSVAAGGTAVLLVEHNLELVMEVADVLTVLNFGQVIAGGKPDAVRRDPAVIAAYIGTEA